MLVASFECYIYDSGIVILVRASGGYKFCCVPSIVASLLLVFGYFLSEAVKEIRF